jgi:hypothetical protein
MGLGSPYFHYLASPEDGLLGKTQRYVTNKLAPLFVLFIVQSLLKITRCLLPQTPFTPSQNLLYRERSTLLSWNSFDGVSGLESFISLMYAGTIQFSGNTLPSTSESSEKGVKTLCFAETSTSRYRRTDNSFSDPP